MLYRDRLIQYTSFSLATISGAVTVFIFYYLIFESTPALQKINVIKFFTDKSWHPLEGSYNLTPLLVGTLVITVGSIVIATPIAILSAIYCNYYAPKSLAAIYRGLTELLAGIPSVIYGLWGIVVLVPIIAEIESPGSSILSGIIILSTMILPTIMLQADISISESYKKYTTPSSALGISKWTSIVKIIMPDSFRGISVGVILGTMRAVGETMAVLMVCGNVVKLPGSIFDPIRTLTANIALEMAYAMGDHRSLLFVCALLLMGIVTLLVISMGIIGNNKIKLARR